MIGKPLAPIPVTIEALAKPLVAPLLKLVAERMPKTVKPSAARIGDTERALTLLWLSAGGAWCPGSMSR
ncbi:MAG: hypothetical protein ABW205_09305 [Burkholderiales bacterium]